MNRIARVLACSPDASVRNGGEAVQLAERAVQGSGGGEAEFLDTLAAAYAEVGRFPEAVQTARRALDLAGQSYNRPLAGDLAKHLALYEAKTPLREPPKNASASRP
jgi:Flp pilus assembly protein TadD